jgi:ribosome-binding factor A
MRREEEHAGYRHARLEKLILEELRALLRDDISDPSLTGVDITAVSLSADYRHARVHFAVGDGGGRAAAERGFTRATPFLRARLADAIDLKRVPDLRFVFDAAVARGE